MSEQQDVDDKVEEPVNKSKVKGSANYSYTELTKMIKGLESPDKQEVLDKNFKWRYKYKEIRNWKRQN